MQNTLEINAEIDDNKYKVYIKLFACGEKAEFCDEVTIDESKYAQMKNFIGRCFLKCACKIFGFLPPWGISTGVKPVKLARMFVSKFGKNKAYEILTEEYMISQNKASMAIEACIGEDRIIGKMNDNPCSVYVSIPFCPTKCNYCSFVSCTTPRLLSLIPQYLQKLCDEIISVSSIVKQNGFNLKSIYIGGGTPAILTHEQIRNLLTTINSCFDLSADIEFTFEAGRPDCISEQKLLEIKNGNVNRLSINTQTSNDLILQNVGRSHTFNDYLNVMELARKTGFKCINTDLIAGLPGERSDSFCKSVTDVSAVNPENITVHAFTLKKSSNYRMSGEKGFDQEQTEAAKMCDFASKYLSGIGYSPYYIYRQKNTVGNLDNAGYSKKGFESIYNVIMMGEYHTVFGVGAGSVTKIVTDNGERVDRIFSPKYPYEFLDDSKYKGFDRESFEKLLNGR